MSVTITIAQIRQHLSHMANAQTSHKDQVDKCVTDGLMLLCNLFIIPSLIDGYRYRSLLNNVLSNTGDNVIEALKVFVEASK